MKKIITNIAGFHPLDLTDIQFLIDSNIETTRSILSALNCDQATPVILSGCVRTVSTDTSITAGYISWNGEVFYVPAQTYVNATGGEFEFFEKVDTYISTGLKAYQTSGVHNTHLHQTAKVSKAGSVPGGNIAYSACPRIEDLLRAKLSNRTWINFAANNEDSFYGAGSTPAAIYRKYLKDLDGFVHLTGSKLLDDISTPTDILIGALPAGFRPAYDILYTYVRHGSNTSATFIKIQIAASGNITALQATGNFLIDLNTIPAFRAV